MLMIDGSPGHTLAAVARGGLGVGATITITGVRVELQPPELEASI